jgi:hypothetical protein
MPQNNSFTEAAMFVIAGLIVIAGTVLLYLGTIDFSQDMLFVGAALSILGVNGALKVPSPSQQAQISQVLNMLPVFANLLHSHVVPQPVASPPAPAPQQAAPVQPKPVVPPVQPAPSDPFSDSGLMQAVNPPKP